MNQPNKPVGILCDICKDRVFKNKRGYGPKELNQEAAMAGWDVLFEETHICPRCANDRLTKAGKG